MEVDFANHIKIYGVVKRTDQFQRENRLILAICILTKLNLRIRIINCIYKKEKQLRKEFWGQENQHSGSLQERIWPLNEGSREHQLESESGLYHSDIISKIL